MSGRALVLGVGNLLWADEGFGVRCVEAFEQRFEGHDQMAVMDGGTQGLYLVDLLREHDPVVIFDAVDYGAAPGSMHLAYDDEIPAFVGAHKMSLHQAGLQDVIACARLLGGCADNMLLIGVQPVELEDYGGSLRPLVRECIPRALQLAEEYLRAKGITLQQRSSASAGEVITPGLDLASYEAGRPDGDSACRFGDERILVRAAKA